MQLHFPVPKRFITIDGKRGLLIVITFLFFLICILEGILIHKLQSYWSHFFDFKDIIWHIDGYRSYCFVEHLIKRSIPVSNLILVFQAMLWLKCIPSIFIVFYTNSELELLPHSTTLIVRLSKSYIILTFERWR